MPLFCGKSNNFIKKLNTPAAVIKLKIPYQMTILKRPAWHFPEQLKYLLSCQMAEIPTL